MAHVEESGDATPMGRRSEQSGVRRAVVVRFVVAGES
jgi:hypothetical protein